MKVTTNGNRKKGMSGRKSTSSKKKSTRFDSKFYESSERTKVRMEKKPGQKGLARREIRQIMKSMV